MKASLNLQMSKGKNRNDKTKSQNKNSKMVLININTKFARENTNFVQAAIILGVHRNTISRWSKKSDLKEYKQWQLYFKAIKLKRGMLIPTE